MSLAWKLMLYSTLVINFLPAARFYRTKYFLFFLSTALLDLCVSFFTLFFHIKSYNFFPYTFALMLLTLPVNGKKNIVLGTISLFLIYPLFKEEVWLPFIISVVTCIYLLNFFREQIFTELKSSSSFLFFHAILFCDSFTDLIKIYFYYQLPNLFTASYTFFLALGIIFMLLITYAGSSKKISVNNYFRKFLIAAEPAKKEFLIGEPQSTKEIDWKELSIAEINILFMASKGFTPGKIAAKTNRTPSTIYSHLNHIKEKLALHSSAEITEFAVEHHEQIEYLAKHSAKIYEE